MVVGPGLAGELFVLAEDEEDDIGLARCRHGLPDQAGIDFGGDRNDLVGRPFPALGQTHAFGIDDLEVVAGRGLETFEHAHDMAGLVGIPADRRVDGVGADDSQGADLGRLKRQCPIAVFQQDHGTPGGRPGKRDGVLGRRSGNSRVGIRIGILEHTREEFEPQDPANGRIDLLLADPAFGDQLR